MDGIVVAFADGFIYGGFKSLDVGADQNVVDAEVHAAAVVTGAWTVSAARVGIVEAFGQAVVRVGDRGGVEVATGDDVSVGSAGDIGSNRVCLQATDGVVLADFSRQAVVFRLRVVVLGVFVVLDDGLVVGLVRLAQFVRLQMVVDDKQRVSPHQHLVGIGAVSFCGVVNLLCRDNGKLGEAGDVVVVFQFVVVIRIDAGDAVDGIVNELFLPLLQADDVGLALQQIVQDVVFPPRFFAVIAKPHHVVGEHLDAAFGVGRGEVEGYVCPDAACTKEHPGNGDWGQPPFDDEPKEEEEGVARQEDREHQPEIGQVGVFLRRDAGGVGTKVHGRNHHEIDGNEQDDWYLL